MKNNTSEQSAANVPQLRFPEFNEEWNKRKLKDVVLQHNSGVYKKSDFYGTGNNIIGISNLYNISSINGQEFRKVPLSKVEIKEYTLDEGDLIYGESSLVREGIAKTLFTTEKGAGTAFAWHTRRYKVDLEVTIPQFVYYYLMSSDSRKFLMSVATQTALTGMTTQDYFSTPFNQPLKEEQQKIADFLGSVDEWLENLRDQKRGLEKYKKGMMQKIFSQETRFKDENGRDFPEWEEKKFGEIATFLKGRGISKDKVTLGGKHECIRYGELYTHYDEIITEVKSKTDSSKLDSVESKFGDVLIPSSGETALDIATVSCINKPNVLLGGDINIIRSDENNNGNFFAYYLSGRMRIEIAKIAQGYSVVHLYSSHLKKLKLMIPVIEEQQKIAEFLSSIDNLIKLKQNHIENAELWKKGIMQRMFI
jgi:type I restriction enzyme, S subunit